MSAETSTLEHDAGGEALVQNAPQEPHAKIEPITTEVADYNPTAAAVAQLRHQLHGRAYDLTTVKGNDEARRDRKRLVSLRTGLERIRSDLNREDRTSIEAHISQRNDEAQRLTEIIVELERPIDDQIRADEKRREEERERKAEAERVRIARIRERIQSIADVARRSVGKPTGVIEERIKLVVAQAIDRAWFAEFAPEAAVVKDDTLTQLRELLATTRQAEQQAEALRAAEAELDRQRGAQRQRDAKAAAQRQREEAERQRQEAERREQERQEQTRRQAELDEQARQQREREAAILARAEELARQEHEAEERRQADARAAEQQRQAELRAQQEDAERRDREAADVAVQRVRDAAPELLAMLRAIVDHWNEFGPERDIDVLMVNALAFIDELDNPDAAQPPDRDRRVAARGR